MTPQKAKLAGEEAVLFNFTAQNERTRGDRLYGRSLLCLRKPSAFILTTRSLEPETDKTNLDHIESSFTLL